MSSEYFEQTLTVLGDAIDDDQCQKITQGLVKDGRIEKDDFMRWCTNWGFDDDDDDNVNHLGHDADEHVMKDKKNMDDNDELHSVKKQLSFTPSTMSNTCKKAFLTCSLFDIDKTGSLPMNRFPDLIEELGEGFYGEELVEQMKSVDPSHAGDFTQDAFVNWHGQFASNNNNDEDDDDNEEIEETRLEALEAFEKIALDCTVSSTDYIPHNDFSKLIKALGATYCEEEHGVVGRKLKKDDKIYKDDYIDWYVDWLFNDDADDDDTDDENEDNEEEDDETKVEQAKGWGNMFIQSKSSWKCPACFIQNNDEDKKCVASEAIRPGHEDEVEKESTSAVTSGSIGASGFTSGGVVSAEAPPTVKLPTAPKNPFASIKIASSESSKPLFSGFTFGSALEKKDSTASLSTFTFGSTSEKKVVDTSSNFTFGNASEKKDVTAPSSGFKFGSAPEKNDNAPPLSEFSFGSAPEEKESKSSSAMSGFAFGSNAATAPPFNDDADDDTDNENEDNKEEDDETKAQQVPILLSEPNMQCKKEFIADSPNEDVVNSLNVHDVVLKEPEEEEKTADLLQEETLYVSTQATNLTAGHNVVSK